jgi:hypothetical protein
MHHCAKLSIDNACHFMHGPPRGRTLTAALLFAPTQDRINHGHPPQAIMLVRTESVKLRSLAGQRKRAGNDVTSLWCGSTERKYSKMLD